MEKHIILIADDVEINRKMLSFIFEEQYQILEAADGVETIDLLEEHHDTLSLIFLDLMMPNKSGLDVLEYMSEKGYMNSIPVIMITGEATVKSEVKAYEYGVSDIIYKPFEPKWLCAVPRISLSYSRTELILKRNWKSVPGSFVRVRKSWSATMSF